MQPKAQPISIRVAKNKTKKIKKGLKTLLYVTLLLANSINISVYSIGSRILVDILVACLLILLLYKLLIHFNVHVHQIGWFHLVDCLDLVDILAVTDQVH